MVSDATDEAQCVVVSRVSASQISTWRECPRKWAFSRIEPRKQHASAARGERVHAHLEAWLRDGAVPPPTLEGRIAREGLHLLPSVGTCEVEHVMEFPHDTVTYVGRIDALYDTPLAVCVLDHKTTKAIDLYAMSSEELAHDAQWVIYAYYGLTRAPTLEYVMGRWVYYQTEGVFRAEQRSILEDRASIVSKFTDLHTKYSLPIIQARGIPPLQVTATPGEACSAYGGCPYRGKCPDVR